MEERSRSLDILRAVAILLVLGRHLTPCSQNNMFFHTLTTLWSRGGWVGVDLFFVLSGFLISGLLFKEHKRFGYISFKRFFIRRGFKIYPSFYILIFVTVLGDIILKRRIIGTELFSELFFLQDYVKGIWSQTWSLAIEEQFYLLLPLLLICLARLRRSKDQAFSLIPAIFIFISVTCLGLRILTCIAMPYTHMTHLFPFHLRIDALFFGVVISYFYHYHFFEFTEIVRRFKYLLLGLGVALFLPAFLLTLESAVFIPTVGLTLFYFASGLILIASVGSDIKQNLFTNSLTSIGRHSYSIYLWHSAVSSLGFWISNRLPLSHYHWLTYAGIYLLGSLFIGMTMAKIIELPMLHLRNKLYPSRVN